MGVKFGKEKGPNFDYWGLLYVAPIRVNLVRKFPLDFGTPFYQHLWVIGNQSATVSY